MTIWAEQVFLLNAALDYGLLAGTVRLRGGRRTARLCWAALLGGLFAVLSLYPIPLVRGMAGRSLGFLLLVLTAFGLSVEALRMAAVFLGLSLALCGIQVAAVEWFRCGTVLHHGGVLILTSWQTLLASAALLYGVCALLSGSVCGKKRELMQTVARIPGGAASFCSLCDTGSFLRDPLTGRPVVLADAAIGAQLLGLSREALRHPVETMAELVTCRPELRPRLIPYRAIGTENGLLLGIRCVDLQVGEERRSGGILAFAPVRLSEDGSYHGLTGG